MTSITTKPDSSQPRVGRAVDLFDNWFDPIETEVVRSKNRNGRETNELGGVG